MERVSIRRMRLLDQERGFTFVEVIVVIAILMILAALALPVYSSAKERARERTCMARLQQIHQALELYESDNPGGEPLHRNVGLPEMAIRRPAVLEPYLGSLDMLHCPETPPCARDRLASSYIWTSPPTPGLPGYESYAFQFDRWFDEPEKGFPVIHCLVHDELYYFPRERHLSEQLNPPFVIRLLPSGAVKAGRYSIHRGHDIARECANR